MTECSWIINYEKMGSKITIKRQSFKIICTKQVLIEKHICSINAVVFVSSRRLNEKKLP
jgi:hypothetical protein